MEPPPLRTLLLGAVPLITLASLAYVGPGPQGTGSGGHLASPAAWVPFEADVRITSPDQSFVVGRFYRGADGSTRLETGPPDSTDRIISIRNVGESKYYSYSPWNGWSRHPMRLPAGGWRPPSVSADNPNLRAAASIEGYEVLDAGGGQGDRMLRAPALNFFPLLVETRGSRREYHNIQLITPPPDLFAPPPGVSIRERPEPRGIVASEPEGH